MDNQLMLLGLLKPWLGPFLMFALFGGGFYIARYMNDKMPNNRVKRILLWRPKKLWQGIIMAFIPTTFMVLCSVYYNWNGHKWFWF